MRNWQGLTQPQTPTDQLGPSPAGWLGGEVVILTWCCFSWPRSRINSVIISKSRIKLDSSYSELQFVFYDWQAAGIVCQVTQGALRTLSWPSKDDCLIHVWAAGGAFFLSAHRCLALFSCPNRLSGLGWHILCGLCLLFPEPFDTFKCNLVTQNHQS